MPGEGYSNTHGGKWSLKNLTQYLIGTRGTLATTTLMEDIGWTVVHSLKVWLTLLQLCC